MLSLSESLSEYTVHTFLLHHPVHTLEFIDDEYDDASQSERRRHPRCRKGSSLQWHMGERRSLDDAPDKVGGPKVELRLSSHTIRSRNERFEEATQKRSTYIRSRTKKGPFLLKIKEIIILLRVLERDVPGRPYNPSI